jgi:rhomboid protease GluP
MAVGLTPKFAQEYQLDNTEQEYFIVIAAEAVKKLNWNISTVSDEKLIAYSTINWSSYGEEISVKIENGIATIQSSCTGNQVVDWGKNKKNVLALIAQIEEVKMNLSEEEIKSKHEAFKLDLVTQNDVQQQEIRPQETKDFSNFFSIFIPTEGYFITPILIIINILIFILMLISGVNIFQPANDELLFWGANFRPYTLDGQWWRLFTSCFIHIGVLHLLLNMYALLYIGSMLEPLLGKTRFLAAYIITGIAASLASLWWNELTISAGASGAIFGLYGVFLALLTTKLLEKSQQKTLLTSIGIYIGYNLVYGLRPDSGIDNAAHIGGLICGFLIGYSFVPSLKSYYDSKLKAVTIGVMLLVLSISVFAICKSIPNDIARYEKEMNRFVTMESAALEVYKLPQGTPKDSLLIEIKERGLYYWNENLSLLKSFDNAELPEALKRRNEKLKEYCKVRIKSYETIYKSVEEETDQYQKEIQEYNEQIEQLITEISEDQLKP